MSRSEQGDDSKSEVVAISQNGQATIPKRFREKLGIEAPGRVQFRETDDGTIVVEPVPSASEMKGFLSEHADASTDVPASQLLRERREKEKRDRDRQFGEDS